MKNKGLSVLLSFVLVLMLTVSFSVPVNAVDSNSSLGSFDVDIVNEVTEDDIDLLSTTSDGVISTSPATTSARYVSYIQNYSLGNFALGSNLDENSLYKVNVNLSFEFISSCHISSFFRNVSFVYLNKPIFFKDQITCGSDNNFNGSYNITLYAYGSDLVSGSNLLFSVILANSVTVSITLDYDVSLTINSIELVSSVDEDSYQSGYNAGYSAGEKSGYSSGYSSGYDDGFNSVDQDAIYDQGFQAGAGSVDTESYYDAGYNAGYSVGFSEGYDQGYDDGYSEGYSLGYDTGYFDSYRDDYSEESSPLNFNILKSVDNFSIGSYPNTFNIRRTDAGNSTKIDSSDGDSILHDYFIDSHNVIYYFFDVLIKANELPILTPSSNWDGCILEVSSNLNSFDKSQISSFNIGISSDSLSSNGNSLGVFNSENFGSTQIINVDFTKTGYSPLYFYLDLNDCNAWFSNFNSGDPLASDSQFPHYPSFNLDIDLSVKYKFYKDTTSTSQDITDQTNQLTNGYDSSSITSSNTALSGSIAEFTGAESQITDQSFGFIDQVQFYDLNMQPQLLACITFCSSWLQSLFVNIGDWGILVMVSLSLGFGLMLIGWFKYRRK